MFQIDTAIVTYLGRMERAGLVDGRWAKLVARIDESIRRDADGYFASQRARCDVVTLGDILFECGEEVAV
jgi:hypothetical protein